MKRLALIDGDEVAFKACAVSTDEIDWGDGEASTLASPARCAKVAEELVEAWSAKVEADSIIVCLSPRDRDNFRRRVVPSYKTDRTEKLDVYWYTVDRLIEKFDTLTFPSLEADDVMGVMSSTEAVRAYGEYQPVIVSSDKDMQTVPCLLFNPGKGLKRKVSPLDADRWWMRQTLTGDPVDGFKGLPGCGKDAQAVKLLDEMVSVETMWEHVVATYKAGTKRYCPNGLTAEDALAQARLARILRPGEIDTDKKLVRLWHPRGDAVWIPMIPKGTE
jgi:DNA polymerase-1